MSPYDLLRKAAAHRSEAARYGEDIEDLKRQKYQAEALADAAALEAEERSCVDLGEAMRVVRSAAE